MKNIVKAKLTWTRRDKVDAMPDDDNNDLFEHICTWMNEKEAEDSIFSFFLVFVREKVRKKETPDTEVWNGVACDFGARLQIECV